MKKFFILQKTLAILLITSFLTIMASIEIKAINQRWLYTFENAAFNIDDSGWIARYGGSVSLSEESPYAGNKCLKLTGRTQAWHSPALKLDEVFEQGGPGVYAITVYVKVNTFAPGASHYGRSIIRGVEETSFVDLRGTNYFCPIASANLTPNSWVCIQGSVRVTSDDIHRGEFYWMLDMINATDNQVIYIDNFSIFKASDSTVLMTTPDGTLVSDITAYEVNDKAFEDYYNYENMPIFNNEDDAAQWYYDFLNSVNYQGQYELIFTFNQNQLNQLTGLLSQMYTAEWWENLTTVDIDIFYDACMLLFNPILDQVPGLSIGLDIAEVLNKVNAQGYRYFSDLGDFTIKLINFTNSSSTTQENITYSICLLRKSMQGGFEYKFYRSDKREWVREQIGIINSEMFSTLVNACSKIIVGNYDSPVESVSYTQRPSINRVYPNYSYVMAYTFRANANYGQ